MVDKLKLVLFRSDRIAKYNQLLRIEEDLDESAMYFGPILASYFGLNEDDFDDEE